MCKPMSPHGHELWICQSLDSGDIGAADHCPVLLACHSICVDQKSAEEKTPARTVH